MTSTAPPVVRLTSIPEEIRSIDLSRIIDKLVRTKGWTSDAAELAAERYRGFLALNLVIDRPVPTLDIDEVWHAHILDTRSYANDCERVFGRMLHHFPYLGMYGDEAAQESQFARTSEEWLARFGTTYASSNAEAGQCNNGGCDGSGCASN